MGKTFRHILFIVLTSLVLFSSCRKEEDKVIPRGKMAKIYAEMMLTDQWLQMEPDVRRLADTTLVYEPILRKYGYDSEDYRRSVFKYLDDPDRFAKILRTTVGIFDKRLKELEAQKTDYKEQEERLRNTERFRTEFKIEEHHPYMAEEPYVHYYDSLSVEIDSLTHEYVFRAIELSDTLYEGLEMVIKIDSTAILDSIARQDSIARLDSVVRPDSLRKLPKKTKVKQAGIRSARDLKLTNE